MSFGTGALRQLALKARALPYDQRGYHLFENRDAAHAAGADPQALQDFDPTDEALDGLLARTGPDRTMPVQLASYGGPGPEAPAGPPRGRGGGWMYPQPAAPANPKQARPEQPPDLRAQFKPFLDVIANAERTAGPVAEAKGYASPYDVPYAYGAYGKPPKPLSQMTMGELKAFQAASLATQQRLKSSNPSTAMGKFQINAMTLDDLQRRTTPPIKDTDVFSPAMQDELAFRLTQDDLQKFMSGQIDEREYQRRLAGRWAGLASPDTGRSNYANQPVGLDSDAVGEALSKLKKR